MSCSVFMARVGKEIDRLNLDRSALLEVKGRLVGAPKVGLDDDDDSEESVRDDRKWLSVYLAITTIEPEAFYEIVLDPKLWRWKVPFMSSWN